jgi:hypothetical protein
MCWKKTLFCNNILESLSYVLAVHYKVQYVQMKSTTLYVPSSELGLPNPSLASECAPPSPQNRGRGGAHSPAGEGLGESQCVLGPNSDDGRKSLALCLLCAVHTSVHVY